MRKKAALVVALVLVATSCYKTFDFDGDDKADVVWIDSVSGSWYSVDAAGASTLIVADTGGIPVTGDYDGDGSFEPAVAGTTAWATFGKNPMTISFARPAGSAADILAVPGMYDGHHKTLPAYYRDTDATWFIEGHDPIQFGSGPSNPNGLGSQREDQDFPVPGDYDGDGITDLATYSPATGMWHIRNSHDLSVTETSLEEPIGVPVPGRYNGSSMDVPAIYTFDARWIIDGHPVPPTYGNADPLTFPVPADYDGDGKAEPSYVTLGQGPAATTWHLSKQPDPNDPTRVDARVVSLTASNGGYAVPAELNQALVVSLARLTRVARCSNPVESPRSC
jgi:hypothetical protein